MRRRKFIALGGAVAAFPFAARAQQPERTRRVGVLMGFATTDLEAQRFQRAWLQRMQELGWTDGTNISFDFRWAAGDPQLFRDYATALISQKPDVIVANTSPAVAALRRETTTIPVVFAQVTDPVGQGFVTNLARPGGNVTGFDFVDFTMGGKWLELLKEIAPTVARVAILHNPQTTPFNSYISSLRSAASILKLEMTEAPVRDDNDIERTIKAISQHTDGGLTVMADVFTAARRVPIIQAAARYRVPAMYPRRIFVADGGLIAYGTDVVELFRSAAGYVDRILKGADPGELPVQRPNKFELAINLKTAKALGLTVPPMLLARADEVIE